MDVNKIKYILATKEQIQAKVASMEAHEAKMQKWMDRFSKNLKNGKA
jgi:hypothetical protein